MRVAPKNIISTTAAPGKPTDGKVNQRVQLLCGVRNELFQTPGKTNGYSPLQETPKRKERSPPSPNVKQAAKKVSLGQKAPQAAVALLGVEQTQEERPQQMAPKEDEEMEWQQNTKKKKKKRAKEEEKRKKAPKQRKKKALPKALLISAQGRTTYADILKEVKKGLAEEGLEKNVDKVQQ